MQRDERSALGAQFVPRIALRRRGSGVAVVRKVGAWGVDAAGVMGGKVAGVKVVHVSWEVRMGW
jgi:hypothetical protein